MGDKKTTSLTRMKKYGRMYPDADYGARFNAWLNSDNRDPYNSFGNGSAMRVSPCAWSMDCGFLCENWYVAIILGNLRVFLQR